MLEAYKFCEKNKEKTEIDIRPLMSVDFDDLPACSVIKQEMQKYTKTTIQEQRQQQSVNIINKDLDQIFKVNQRQTYFESPLPLELQTYYQYVKYPMCFCWIRARLTINQKLQQPLQEEYFSEDNILIKLQPNISKLYLKYVPEMQKDEKRSSFYRAIGDKLSQDDLPPYNSYQEVFADCLMVGLNQWVDAGKSLIRDILDHSKQLSQQQIPSWCEKLTDLQEAIEMVKQINNNMDKQIIRLIQVGDSGVGKTALIIMLSEHRFTKCEPTIGSEYAKFEYTSQQKTIQLNIWDLSGSQTCQNICRSYYRQSNVALLCFDLTNQNSLKSLERYVQEITNIERNCILVLVGCKNDLKIQVNDSQIKEFCQKHNVSKYFPTSAKNNINVDEVYKYCGKIAIETGNCTQLKDNEQNQVKQFKKSCC